MDDLELVAAFRALAPTMRAEWCSSGWGMLTTGGATVNYGGSCWRLADADPRDLDLFETYARYEAKRRGHSGLADEWLDELRRDGVAYVENATGDDYVDADGIRRPRTFGTIENVCEASARYCLKLAANAPAPTRGDFVEHHLKSKGLTVNSWAKAGRFDPNTGYRYLTGKNISPESRVKLAAGLGVDIRELPE